MICLGVERNILISYIANFHFPYRPIFLVLGQKKKANISNLGAQTCEISASTGKRRNRTATLSM